MENKKSCELDKDLKNLYKKWLSVYKKLKTSNLTERIHGELNRSSAILRDLLNSEFNKIHVNNEDLHSDLKEYLSRISPEQRK